MMAMANKKEAALRQQQKMLAIVVFLAGVLVLAVSSFLWFEKVHGNPNNVFWGMVDSSFKSYGRSSSTKQSDGTQNVEQVQETRLQLGPQNVAVGQSMLLQNSGTADQVSVTSQSISTPTKNFVRYSDINVNQKLANGATPDFSAIENTWASEQVTSTGGSSFGQAVYGSLGHIPLGNLSPSARKQIVQYIKDNRVYDVKSFNKEYRNNRAVYTYEATVNMVKYVTMLKMFDAATGLHELDDVEPTQFMDQKPIEVTLSVDILSRNLVEFAYKGAAQRETLGSYGATRYITLPAQTISIQELQQKLQSTLSGK